MVHQAALRPSKPVDLKRQALTAPSRRATRHPGRDQLWLALRVWRRACCVPAALAVVLARRVCAAYVVVESDFTMGAGLLASWIGVVLVLWTGATVG